MLDRVRIVEEDALGPIVYVDLEISEVGVCLCHRRKDRSLPVLGLERWLCARCVGIWLGGLAGAGLLAIGSALPWTIGAALVLPLAVDWGRQTLGGRPSRNVDRLLTGLMFGLAVAWWGAIP